jgi:hypothetical protein
MRDKKLNQVLAQGAVAKVTVFKRRDKTQGVKIEAGALAVTVADHVDEAAAGVASCWAQPRTLPNWLMKKTRTLTMSPRALRGPC